MAPVGPIAELREEVEIAAQDGTLDAPQRLTKLRHFRRELTALLGLAETYIGDVELETDAESAKVHRDRMELRANADIREELIRRGKATAEQLDEMGYLSHEALDELASDGQLEEAALVSTLTSKARSAIVKQQWRGRGGKWIDMPDTATALDDQSSTPANPSDDFHGDLAKGESVAKKIADKSDAPESSGDTDVATGEDAPDPKQKFLKRVEKEDKEASDTARAGLEATTPAERHVNASGKTSQRTFLAFANLSANQPTTSETYAVREPDGTLTFDETRRALHERIIDSFLRQRTWNSETEEWELDPDAPYLEGVEEPHVMFSGGGYAAGKSSVLKKKRKEGGTPDSGYDGPPLVLDPDAIKAELPEFRDNLGTDPEANLLVYEEAWEIAQEVQRRAAEKKMNMIVDGISNTDPDEMLERVRFFSDSGYAKMDAVYVDIPTESALKRANGRMVNAESDSDKRFIPEVIMRAVHRDVAATVPELAQRLKAEGIALNLEVWDNDQGKGENGWNPPKRFFHFDPETGELVVDDEELWDRFKKKADETIPGVEG